jgi:4-carboxymuconolactone decarboxylase
MAGCADPDWSVSDGFREVPRPLEGAIFRSRTDLRMVARADDRGATQAPAATPGSSSPPEPMEVTDMSHEGAVAVRNIADLAPKLAELTDEVVFGDIWERPGLSKRDRSLITVSALIAMYRTEQLPIHLHLALDNDLSPHEIVEAITHLAFYTGWPNAFTALNVAKSVFADQR